MLVLSAGNAGAAFSCPCVLFAVAQKGTSAHWSASLHLLHLPLARPRCPVPSRVP